MTSIREIPYFLEFCNVYQRSVKGFSRIVAPLNEMLLKSHVHELDMLGSRALLTFEELSSKLTSPPILTLPRSDGSIRMEMDAYREQVGAVLIQDKAGGEKNPIGYFSCTLTV